MPFKSICSAVLLAAVVFPAFAQGPAPAGTPTVIRGSIESFDGTTLTVDSREGQKIAMTLAAPVSVRGVQSVPLSAIKAGDRLGVAARPDAGGRLHAQSITVFPAWMHVPDGQRPWDLTPGSIMTNGTVGQVTKVSRSRVLRMQFGDKTVDVEVTPKTPVVTYVEETPRELRRRRAVTVFARKMADGSIVAAATVVQRGTVKPPM